jgi:hypothetical protein
MAWLFYLFFIYYLFHDLLRFAPYDPDFCIITVSIGGKSVHDRKIAIFNFPRVNFNAGLGIRPGDI